MSGVPLLLKQYVEKSCQFRLNVTKLLLWPTLAVLFKQYSLIDRSGLLWQYYLIDYFTLELI